MGDTASERSAESAGSQPDGSAPVVSESAARPPEPESRWFRRRPVLQGRRGGVLLEQLAQLFGAGVDMAVALEQLLALHKGEAERQVLVALQGMMSGEMDAVHSRNALVESFGPWAGNLFDLGQDSGRLDKAFGLMGQLNQLRPGPVPPGGGGWMGRQIFRSPLLGPWVREPQRAAFFGAMAIGFDEGLSLGRCVDMAVSVLTYEAGRHHGYLLGRALAGRHGFPRSMEICGWISPMERVQLEAAEEGGRLSSRLMALSESSVERALVARRRASAFALLIPYGVVLAFALSFVYAFLLD